MIDIEWRAYLIHGTPPNRRCDRLQLVDQVVYDLTDTGSEELRAWAQVGLEEHWRTT